MYNTVADSVNTRLAPTEHGSEIHALANKLMLSIKE